MPETFMSLFLFLCFFLIKNILTKEHAHCACSLPCINSGVGEQEAVQAAVGWQFAFDLCVTGWEGLNDLDKGLWEYASLVVHCALREAEG